MSTATPSLRTRLGLRPMRPRDPTEAHRTASPLELFFDLVFVVAVSLSSSQLHHAESQQHLLIGVGTYLALFFAVWWAWMNFTWFATAFDTDDWLYRVLTFVQMAGVLVLAAGAEPAMTDGDFSLVTWGYVVMRLALVAQWLRASTSDPGLRRTALRYAGGVTLVQVLWVARLWLPHQGGIPVFLALVLTELLVPGWGESARPTPWHPHHIAERYGLFTLILLGESILASTSAMVDAIHHTDHLAPLVGVSIGGLILASGMWWIYFVRPHHDSVTDLRSAMLFGYGHYIVFAAAGAFSAGIEVAIDDRTHATELGPVAAAATLNVPVAIFALGAWALTLRTSLSRRANAAMVLSALGVAASSLTPVPLAIAAVLIVLTVLVIERGVLPSKGTPADTVGVD